MTTTIRREYYRRGFSGKLFKFLFIAFNVVMALWLFSYWGTVGEQMQTISSEAGRTGAGIGAAVGTSFIGMLWMFGAVVLGLLTLLTRGQKVVVEETPDGPQPSALKEPSRAIDLQPAPRDHTPRVLTPRKARPGWVKPLVIVGSIIAFLFIAERNFWLDDTIAYLDATVASLDEMDADKAAAERRWQPSPGVQIILWKKGHDSIEVRRVDAIQALACQVTAGTSAELLSYDPAEKWGTVRVTLGRQEGCQGIVMRDEMRQLTRKE